MDDEEAFGKAFEFYATASGHEAMMREAAYLEEKKREEDEYRQARLLRRAVKLQHKEFDDGAAFAAGLTMGAIMGGF